MPFGIDIPGTSGGGDGGGGGSGDLDEQLKKVDELEGKLKDSEKMIFDMLNRSLPQVVIPMPKLDPSMFGGSGGDVAGGEKEPLLADAGSPQASPKAEGQSKAKQKAEEVRKKALEAKKNAEQARKEMAEEAKNAMGAQVSAGKQMVAQSFAAAMSVATGVGMSMAPLPPFLGQFLAAVLACLINFAGLASSWKGRAGGIFQVLSKVFDRMKKKVVTILDTVDDMIMGPLEKLENAIEDMAEEQKPNLDKMKQLESTIKMAKPDFDLPDPEDLKKPLDGCGDMIDDFVDKAKKEVPDKLEEMIQSTLTGRLATDEGTFNCYVVMIPLLIVLLFNIGLAVAQVCIMFKPEQAAPDHAEAVARSLRGASNSTATGPPTTGLPTTGPPTTGLTTLPKGLSMDSIMPYIQPALVQIVLALLQMIAAFILSAGPRICGWVNDAITNFGKKINERINNRIKGAVDKVFGIAFKEVKEKSDMFFPKMKEAIAQLKKALETAGKAGALLDAAKGVGGLF